MLSIWQKIHTGQYVAHHGQSNYVGYRTKLLLSAGRQHIGDGTKTILFLKKKRNIISQCVLHQGQSHYVTSRSIYGADVYTNTLLQIYVCAEIYNLPNKCRMFNWMQMI